MEFSGFPFCVSFMLIAFSAVANAVQVSPKLDFGDTSPGISPDDIKAFVEKEKTSVNSGVVKAVLEVKVGESIVIDKYPAKSDKRGDKNSTKTNILICNLEGDCKLHEFKTDGIDDDEEEGDTKKLKPIIVTDFDEDPLKGNNDDDDRNDGKKNPNVPVIVGYRGAVKDDGFYYTGHSNGQGIQRLPTYYGTTLRPGFHQPYPGPNIYGEVSRPPPRPRPGFNYGYGPRTPSPYGHLHPPRTPGSFHAIITPLGSGNSVGGLDRPTNYWPIKKPTVGGAGVVAVHGKVDFDEDDINVGVTGPLYPSSGSGNVKVDGKLGEPLHISDP